MANGWTQQRKAKQRAGIYHWRPWEKSTGPKTQAGKDAISRNAWKHGGRSQAFAAERRMIEQFLAGE